MASNTYHESLDLPTEDTRNMHRAIVSLMEEMEAIDCISNAPTRVPIRS